MPELIAHRGAFMPLRPFQMAEAGGSRVAVSVARHGDELQLAYDFREMADLVYPLYPNVGAGAAQRRQDGLWQSTCCEFFVGTPGHQEAYAEWHGTFSGHWALYQFANYRQGMTPLASPPPAIAVFPGTNGATLQARVPLAALRQVLPGEPDSWRWGFAVVTDHRCSGQRLWALAHPDAAQADFHNPAGWGFSLADAVG